MSSNSRLDTASISIEGPVIEDHWVPSDILERIIQGFQHAVWIIGFALEDLRYEERFRPANELKKNYAIQWGPASSGSYVQPLRFPNNQLAGIRISEILAAISSEKLDHLKKIIPDSRLRDKLYDAMLTFLPKPGEAWTMNYHHNAQIATLDAKSHQRVKLWRVESLSHQPKDEVLTIKGDLLRIDFEAKRVEVRYPPTKRALKCYYLPEIEDSILESRKDLIEVTGKFELDTQGHPERLAEVTSVQPIDLSEMTISNKIEQEGRALNIIQSLTFTPKLDEETKQFYEIEDQSIGINVSAHTREELLENLMEQIFFLWETYGSNQVNTSTLTKNALNTRNALRKRFQEI